MLGKCLSTTEEGKENGMYAWKSKLLPTNEQRVMVEDFRQVFIYDLLNYRQNN